MSEGSPTVATPTLTLDQLDERISVWHTAKLNAEHWKGEENRLRVEIFGAMFPVPVEGQKNKLRINHGMALIGDYRLNYKADVPALEASREFIPPEVFAAVVVYKPEIRPGAYRALPTDTDEQKSVKQLFDSFITITPGTPGLDIKPATKVRW